VIGLFKQKTPANILFVFILGILLKLPVFKHATLPVIDEHAAVLYKLITSFLNSFGSNSVTIYVILTYLLLFSQAMQLNKLINDYRMTQKVTFLPAASYMLLTSLFPEWNVFSAPLLVNSLVLMVFMMLFKLYNQSNVKGSIYNIGLTIGLSTFIFWPSILLFGWLLLGLLVIRTFRINEWLICLVGVLTPFYFYFAWLLFTGFKDWDHAITSFWITLPFHTISLWTFISIFLTVIPFLIGGYLVQANLRKMLIQVRKNWSLLFIYLLFVLFIPFLNNVSTGFENWMLITIPIASFHACAYIYPKKSWLPSLIFWVIVLFVFIYQYVGTGW
jgi:Family of unknown function (DUF6427)